MTLGDQRAVPAAAVLLVQRHQLAAGDPGRAAGLGEQHQREQPGHLGLVGQQGAQDPRQPDRLGGELVADRRGVGRGREVALVEDQVEHGEHAVHPRSAGRRPRAPGRGSSPPLIFFFARVIRCAIVVSGTRNACAISATVRPPSSRRVSATRASGASAGWQQVKISRSRSSSTMPVGSWGVSSLIMSAAWCLASRWDSRRSRSIARLPAVVVSQPPGLGGTPSTRPPLDRGEQRLAGRLLGDVDVAEAADQRGDDPAVLLAVDPLDRGLESVESIRRQARARPGRAGPRPCRAQAFGRLGRPLQGGVEVGQPR